MQQVRYLASPPAAFPRNRNLPSGTARRLMLRYRVCGSKCDRNLPTREESRASGDGEQMHDSVGRAADRLVHGDGVLDGVALMMRRPQVLQTRSTARRPLISAMDRRRNRARARWRSRSGHARAPGGLVMVDAVPITVQPYPALRAMPPSISHHSSSLRRPVRSRSSLRASVPAPSSDPSTGR